MENLLETQLNNVLKALLNYESYQYKDNVFDIDCKNEDGNISISLKCTPNNQMDEFSDYLSNMDDDLFIEVCESLGNDKITQINTMLANPEKAESAILRFKTEVKKVVNAKIEKLKSYV